MFRKLTVFLILMLVSSLVPPSNGRTDLAQAQQIVTDGLVSYWSFDQSQIVGKTVKDTKSGHDGTIAGNPVVVQGKVNEALSLNDGKAGDSIVVPDAPDLHTLKALTICLWINFRGTKAPNNWPCIMRKGHSSGATYFFGLWDLTNQVYMTFTPPWQDKQSGLNIKQGDWSYVALRVDGDKQKVFFYVDGEVKEVALGFATLPDTNADITIGGGVPEDAADLNATIDELCIYNRVLSDNEVQQNQKATRGVAVEDKRFLSLTWGVVKNQ